MIYRFVCKKKSEITPSTACPDGWTSDNKGRCYFVSTEKVDHKEALGMCPRIAYKSRLLLPYDYEQNKFVSGKNSSIHLIMKNRKL